jgi:hypothetical protein
MAEAKVQCMTCGQLFEDRPGAHFEWAGRAYVLPQERSGDRDHRQRQDGGVVRNATCTADEVSRADRRPRESRPQFSASPSCSPCR